MTWSSERRTGEQKNKLYVEEEESKNVLEKNELVIRVRSLEPSPSLTEADGMHKKKLNNKKESKIFPSSRDPPAPLFILDWPRKGYGRSERESIRRQESLGMQVNYSTSCIGKINGDMVLEGSDFDFAATWEEGSSRYCRKRSCRS